MADPVTGKCQYEHDDGTICGNDVEIGNPDWLMNIMDVGRDELRYCDDHLDAMLEDQTIDLGIGVGHTHSEQFQDSDSGFGDMIPDDE